MAELNLQLYASKLDMPVNPTTITYMNNVNGIEIAVIAGISKLVYRSDTSLDYIESPISGLNVQHTVDYRSGAYYLDDTSNHRLIKFTDIAVNDYTAVSEIAGVTLNRPHFVLYNPSDDFIYVIDGNGMLYRFKDFGVGEEVLNLSSVVGYARSLFLKNGIVHVVNSSGGKVVKINSFADNNYEVFTSHGKKQLGDAGSWDKTGFVLNHVYWFDNYYYASNYFTATYADGTDPNINKLVRFRNLEDLTTGLWEDLSGYVPDDFLPYFFSSAKGKLFIAGWDDEDRAGGKGRVFKEIDRPEMETPFTRRSRIRVDVSGLALY